MKLSKILVSHVIVVEIKFKVNLKQAAIAINLTKPIENELYKQNYIKLIEKINLGHIFYS